MRNLLLECTPIDSETGATVTIRMSSRHASPAGVYTDELEWVPAITSWDSRTLSLTNNGQTQQAQVSHGSIKFHLQGDLGGLGNYSWSNLSWDGCSIEIWAGNDGDPFSAYRQVFNGVGSAISRDGVEAELPLLGADALLNTPILSASYGGTGGANGNVSLLGTLKPWLSGYCQFIDPLLIDPQYQVYQVHGYGPVADIENVYEYGQPINDAGAAHNVGSYADLIALDLADGTWAKSNPQGLFRLANEPSKKLSATVQGALDGATYPTTIDKIAAHLLKAAGIPLSQIDADSLSAFSAASYGINITEASDVGDVLREMLYEANGYILPTSTGVWRAGRLFGTNGQGELRSDRSAAPLVRSWKQLTVAAPVYSVRVNADRCWNVHAEADISPAITQLSDQQFAQQQQIADAITAAQDAQAAADVEKQRIDEIVADNILDRSEKVDQNRRYATEAQAHVALIAQNSSFDVSAERANYDACWNSLTNYLNGLSPAFTDLTQSTPIVAADYEDAWKNYELAKITLINAMSGYAATTAHWGGVTGPGTPEYGATVGAPPGTYVGGVPVEQVIADLNAATTATTTIIQQLPALVLPLLQDPIDSITALNIESSASAAILSNTNLAAIRELGTQVDAQGNQIATDKLQLTSRLAANEAGLEVLSTTVATQNDATASEITTLASRTGKNEAAIKTEIQTRTDADSAMAKSITTLQASVGDISAAVQETASVVADINGELEATWTLKVQTEQDGTTVVGGMGIVAKDGQVDVAFLTDSFRIYTADGAKQMFYLDSGGVYMPSVTVDTLKANTVTAAHIVSGSVTGIMHFVAPDVYIPNSETILLETPSFWIGDTMAGFGIGVVSFLQDGTATHDTAIRMKAYVDYGDGGGYQLVRSQIQGIRTSSGDTEWAIPVSFPIAISATNAVRFKITATGSHIDNNGNGADSGSYCRSIELDVFTGQR